MRAFVTGASGFIGSAVVPELLSAGHQVLALARSDASAAALRDAGVEVLRGSLEDVELLRAGARRADGVVHLAFNHDFSKFAESAALEARVLETMGAALEGSGGPLVVASGVLGLAPGRVGTELDEPPSSPRQAGMKAALGFVARGVRTSIVRNAPVVHGVGDGGFIARLVAIARDSGVSGFVGDGESRWPAVHRLDAARLFRLAFEDAPAGAAVHAVADGGIPIRAIADTIGRRLNLPVASIAAGDAKQHFGFLAPLLALDSPASSAITRERLGWHPTQPGLLEDLESGHYFEPVRVGG